MATKTEVRLIDDLDGESPASETVSFGIGSTAYEIDLSEGNAKELRAAFERYVSAARKVGKSRRTMTRTESPIDSAAVRRWCEANNVPVNTGGRLSKQSIEAFRAAGN